ncbi:MAG: MBL fold metallo-hydrolase [Bdellovibrio sp.]
MSLKISRILHAGYVFECDEVQIAFDPVFENPFSRNCHAFPSVKFDCEQIKKLKFAAVFISHFHDDHCSLESLDLLDRETSIYVYCLHDELFSLIKQLGFKYIFPLKIDDPVSVGPFEVIPRRALDADVDSMFQVKGGGVNILNVVDSWIDWQTVDQLAQQAPWDMVLWPFQTMREIDVLAPSRALAVSTEVPTEWIEQLKRLNPRYIVPSSCQFIQESWSWYNHAMFPITYRQFTQEVESVLPNSRVVRLNPSVSVVLDKTSLHPSSPLVWVQPVGEQNVDYEFNAELKPPSTKELSQKFPPLSQNQKKKVYDYCLTELAKKYNAMDPPIDTYFKKSRLWRLSVFDHKGEAVHFHYNLKNGNCELMEEVTQPISWITEIPLSRFYGALEEGEALTSMYIRINDIVFEPAIEEEVKQADVIEDPLIRSLFYGAFGAYQAAQLKRLKARGTQDFDIEVPS